MSAGGKGFREETPEIDDICSDTRKRQGEEEITPDRACAGSEARADIGGTYCEI